MITKTITVEIPAGLEVNAKSIMGLMTLGLRAGESVTVHADGSDEEDAVDKIEAYLTGRAVINARA